MENVSLICIGKIIGIMTEPAVQDTVLELQDYLTKQFDYDRDDLAEIRQNINQLVEVRVELHFSQTPGEPDYKSSFSKAELELEWDSSMNAARTSFISVDQSADRVAQYRFLSAPFTRFLLSQTRMMHTTAIASVAWQFKIRTQTILAFTERSLMLDYVQLEYYPAVNYTPIGVASVEDRKLLNFENHVVSPEWFSRVLSGRVAANATPDVCSNCSNQQSFECVDCHARVECATDCTGPSHECED